MKRWLISLTALFSFAIGAPIASAVDTTINFDNVAPGPLTDQFRAQGAVFASPADFGFTEANSPTGLAGCPVPQIIPLAGTRSPGQAVQLAVCARENLGPPIIGFMVLENWRSSVTVYVEDAGNARVVDSDRVARLTAYDWNLNLVADRSVAFTRGQQPALTVTASTPSIAYVFVTGGNVAFDDLTFDNPSVPPAPQVKVFPPVGRMAAIRGSTSLPGKIRLQRFNGSTGPVNLSVTGLPAGVTGSTFTPNPATGVGSDLKLSALADAPVSPGVVATVTATPSGPAAGTIPTTAGVNVDVVDPFTLEPVVDRNGLVPGQCERNNVDVIVHFAPGFNDPVNLAVATSGTGTGTGTDTFSASLSQTTVFGDTSSLGSDARVSIRVETTSKYTGDPFGAGFPRVTLSAAPPASSLKKSASIQLGFERMTIGTPRTKRVSAPTFLHPGTDLSLSGRGLCPDTRIRFGFDSPDVAPTSIDADGKSLRVRVPRASRSGRIYVFREDQRGDAQQKKAFFSEPITVEHWIGTNSLPMKNYSDADIHWGDLTDVYGDDTKITLDPCSTVSFGLVECGVATPIPAPGALVVLGIANIAAAGGHCYGFSAFGMGLADGTRSAGSYPLIGTPARPAAFDIAAAGGPSYQARREIAKGFTLQYSRELAFLSGISRGVGGFQNLHDSLTRELAEGRPVGIRIQDSLISGHAVTAYDLTDNGDGSFDIWIDDSNAPLPRTDDEPGNAPATVRALTSHIHIDRSGWKGVRSFRTSGAVVSSPDWTGGFGSMDLYTVAQLRGQHRLITGLPDLIRVIVSGSAPGADPTGITPIQRIDPKAATATVLAAGAGGANAMGIFGKGYAASVAMRQGGGRATFDPRTGQLGLTGTGETKATLDLARTSAAGSVTAGLDIAGGGSSIVTVSRAGVADITHTGTAATVSLRLGSTRAGRMPSGTRSQAIRLGAGERLSVKLAGGRVVGTVTRGGTARRLAIVDTLTPPRRPIIRRVAVTRGNGNLVVTSSIRVAGKASDPVSIGLAVLRGKKVVYRTSLATDPEALRKPLVISTGRIANPKGLRVVLVATAFRVAGGATEAASSGKITNVK